MDVSVVTPSLNMLGYLKRCVSSVRDQNYPRCEHIIMDGGSTDGTAEWLAQQPSLVSAVGPDNGMYDAVNLGFRRARGRIIAHLNCDEQYLPGTLDFVTRYFDAHPNVDLLFGDTLTVRPDGSLIAFRKTIRPLPPVLSLPPLYVPTAAMFFRRRIIDEAHFYDASYTQVADLAWVQDLVRHGYRLRHVRRYCAAFTITGTNMSQVSPSVAREVERFLRGLPWWIRGLRREWRAVGWIEKLLAGCYTQATPLAYSIYTSSSATLRSRLVAETASFRWRG